MKNEQGEGLPGRFLMTKEMLDDCVSTDFIGLRLNQLAVGDIAFCLKTFERPKAAQRCVDSILAMYPAAKIYQADDSRKTSAGQRHPQVLQVAT